MQVQVHAVSCLACSCLQAEVSLLGVQAITSLVFTQHSGGLLLSGGEDTVVSTWVLMEVLDASLSQQAMQQQPPPPLYSW